MGVSNPSIARERWVDLASAAPTPLSKQFLSKAAYTSSQLCSMALLTPVILPHIHPSHFLHLTQALGIDVRGGMETSMSEQAGKELIIREGQTVLHYILLICNAELYTPDL